MGSDDIFKKRRAERKQRRHEYRIPRANSFLIVTEGKRTEPLYFNGMKRLIEKKNGGNIDVVENPVIDISAKSRGATSHLNTGFICIFTTVTPRFTEMSGVKGWMRFSGNTGWETENTKKITRIYMIW